ncbi:ATP-binding protein [Desulfoprunum sp.]|uniref:ATP-binding protein n=1 Tax=Desulfoprunum sp. TaxID=2020866 RepID=UPI003C76F2A6
MSANIGFVGKSDCNCLIQSRYNYSKQDLEIQRSRIVFTNPGKLYGNLRIGGLERDDYVSSLRNRLLAEARYLTGDIDRQREIWWFPAGRRS